MAEFDAARYQVQPIKVARTKCDHSFNCRGRISRDDCVELARDIKENGLDFPIHVQPYSEGDYDFRIISGHRRFTAFQINGEDTIPAVVRVDLADEIEAREANLRENIQRSDLNIVQEADAISFFIVKGYNVTQVAEKIGKSNGWVEVRRRLVHLPEFVRRAAQEGTVNQGHINQLWKYRNDSEKMSELIRRIKEKAEQGERAIVIREEVQIEDFAKVRRPKPHELNDFLEVVAGMVTNKLDQPEYFAHRILSWCAGYISQAQLYVSLRRECERLGLPFTPPSDVKKILDGVAKV